MMRRTMRRHALALLVTVVPLGCTRPSARSIDDYTPRKLSGEVVSFASGALVLHGVVYLPAGAGPFPAVLYNHGGAPGMLPADAAEALGPSFAARGWAFFMPFRRGQGLSLSAGPYIMDEVNAASAFGGKRAGAAKLVSLLETEHLDDQIAALVWLRAQGFVDPARIAVGGNSFGGIETLLGVEREAYCAGFDSAGAAQTWATVPELRERLTRAVRAARAPIFLFQARNDYDLSPTEVLSATLKDAGKPFVAKIYPPFGNSAGQGHTLGYFGFPVWADDVIGFLGEHCRPTDHRVESTAWPMLSDMR
ncbi:MAG TPA: prolyl oligopeptidase family serine peptidase [Polyangiaceae bacterium]|nr:prolyl oligopeptidase family serine peptidase [Polyangiaceae bacterium]